MRKWAEYDTILSPLDLYISYESFDTQLLSQTRDAHSFDPVLMSIWFLPELSGL
jgi:hypothetical protein